MAGSGLLELIEKLQLALERPQCRQNEEVQCHMRLKSRHWQDHAMLSAKLTLVIAVNRYPNSLHLRFICLQVNMLDGSPNGLTTQAFSSFKRLRVAASCLLERLATQHQSDSI